MIPELTELTGPELEIRKRAARVNGFIPFPGVMRKTVRFVSWHVAERQGFEPWITLARHTAFREQRLQPLGHLSSSQLVL